MTLRTLLKTTSKAAILSSASAVLIGCGGGGSSSTPAQAVPPAPAPVVNFDVAGTVSGLEGQIVIDVNGETITQDVDGGFEFTDVVVSGSDVTISLVSDPFGQSCEITTPLMITNVSSDATGVVVECTDIPVANVSVKNFFTGEDIAGAEVSLSRQDGEETITESVTVDDAGIAAFEVPLSAGRLSFSTDPVGFGAQSTIIDAPSEADLITTDLFVQAVDITMTFDNAVGGDVMMGDDSLATLPANGFVDANGAQVVGDVNLELTVIDPSQSVDLMPGDFQAQDPETGETSQIESFGALDLTFEDSAGNPVQLAEGETATLRIPVAERVAEGAPATMPLYFYDEEAGFWVEEGSVQATGCVVDSEGQPLAGIRIRSEGVNYIGSSRSISDVQGVFTIPVRVNSVQRLATFRGVQSRTVTLSSAAEDFTFADAADPDSCLVVGTTVTGGLATGSAAITLTWGENPRDLDSHLFGVPETETEENVPFEIFFGNREQTINGQTLFLDVDDTRSFGPEIVTVPNFPYEGVYTYAVNLFSGTGTIASSPARVEVNLGGDITVYGPPEGEPTTCWGVLRFIVDAQGAVTLETIGTWEESGFCRSGDGIFDANDAGQKPAFVSQKVRTK